MRVSTGSRLGPYEVLAPLGAGGMGEVWRARDTRLGREVAIKVLPADVALDSDRLKRFEKEARAASSLNHPAIVTIYEIERVDSVSFIAMELVSGKTLREVIAAGPLSTRQLLVIAVQIAEGLARAHTAGIVHRDLKPENVMVTKEGLVKILDFGLAKLSHPDLEGDQPTSAPTVSEGTRPGMVMGTVGYMSPEQASGHPVDFRSDQFALGSMLYEMATGKSPFKRATAAQTLAAIIQDDPEPIEATNPKIPAPLRWIVDRCLAKDADERYGTTRDLARELATVRDHLSQIGSVEASAPEPRRRRPGMRELLGWAAAAGLALLVAFLVARRPSSVTPNRVQVSLVPPPVIGTDSDIAPPTISPDGRRVVFRAQNSLWVRAFTEKEWQKLPGTEGGAFPFWAPDSQTIGFVTLWDFKLKRVGITGTTSQLISEAPHLRGASWGADDTIIFGQLNGFLYRVSAGGGQPTPLTRLDAKRHDLDHRWPYFLPDGRRFLYLLRTDTDGSMTLAAGSLDSTETRILGKVASTVAYAPPGYLLSTRTDRTLIAQPFDVRALRLSGVPFAIAENVLFEITAPAAAFSVSSSGTLVYQSGPVDSPFKLAWLDRSGKLLETFGPTGTYPDPVLSPDGTRLATDSADPESGVLHLCVYDFAGGTMTRLTFAAADDRGAVWSPDGSQIVFNRSRAGGSNLYRKSANGSGTEERLLQSDLYQKATDWSPDGAYLLYLESTSKAWEEERGDLWALPMTGERKPFRVAQNVFTSAGAGKFSPDGHYVAFTSEESGQLELRVQAFPRASRRWQVSTGGGSVPRWRRDGKELFYVSADNKLTTVQTKTGSSFEASPPRQLFQRQEYGNYHASRRSQFKLSDWPYDVARDGSRFLMVVPDPDTPKPPITVVFNWLQSTQLPQHTR